MSYLDRLRAQKSENRAPSTTDKTPITPPPHSFGGFGGTSPDPFAGIPTSQQDSEIRSHFARLNTDADEALATARADPGSMLNTDADGALQALRSSLSVEEWRRLYAEDIALALREGRL